MSLSSLSYSAFGFLCCHLQCLVQFCTRCSISHTCFVCAVFLSYVYVYAFVIYNLCCHINYAVFFVTIFAVFGLFLSFIFVIYFVYIHSTSLNMEVLWRLTLSLSLQSTSMATRWAPVSQFRSQTQKLKVWSQKSEVKDKNRTQSGKTMPDKTQTKRQRYKDKGHRTVKIRLDKEKRRQD